MIVFDIDGTLSIVSDRIRFLQQTPKDWDSFYAACDQDKPNTPIIRVCQQLQSNNIILFVTGRRESSREKTIEWLRNNNIAVNRKNLYMRKNDDTRHDTVVKPELIKNHINGNSIDVIFEYRGSMVARWRELGLCCCQVADGNF